MLITILSFLIVLGVLIFIHEFGHYIMAKKSGIKVEEFALGFGPRILSKKKGETVYSIRLIPLGGFCNMTGEFPPDKETDEEELKIYRQAEKEGRCFHQKSILTRFLVIFMGPFMNFMLAAFIFIFIFAVFGLPVDSSHTTVIGELDPSKPAAEAGLQPGDKIIAVADKEVNSWEEMAKIIHGSAKKKVSIKFERNNNIKEVLVIPEYNEEIDAAVIGIYPQLIRERINIFKAIKLGLLQTYRVVYFTLAGFIQMISNRSTEGLGGPVMIASIVGQAARVGLSNLLSWMAIISVNLGIINLLPFPALDGGRILFIIFEIIRGKPVPPEKEGFVHFIGFVILITLMVFIIYRDIVRAIF